MKCILINCFVFVCVKNPCDTIVSFYLFIVLLWSVFILLLTMVIINFSGVNSNFPPCLSDPSTGNFFICCSVCLKAVFWFLCDWCFFSFFFCSLLQLLVWFLSLNFLLVFLCCNNCSKHRNLQVGLIASAALVGFAL